MKLKKAVRQEKIFARKALEPNERTLFSNKISNKLLDSELYKQANVIMSYRAMWDEVDLSEFVRGAYAEGKRLCYPRCISKTEMIALEPENGMWTEGAFGIKEPDLEFAKRVQPEEIDLVICPCASFDEDCNRLGMGAGYYDRFLEYCTNASIVAVAFEAQKADSIPMDEYDKIMDMVITEKVIYMNQLGRRK